VTGVKAREQSREQSRKESLECTRPGTHCFYLGVWRALGHQGRIFHAGRRGAPLGSLARSLGRAIRVLVAALDPRLREDDHVVVPVWNKDKLHHFLWRAPMSESQLAPSSDQIFYLGAEGDDHEWRRIQSKHLFMAESSVPGSGGRAWRRESGWQSRAIGPAMVQRIRRARSLRVGFGDVMSLEGPKRRGVSAEVE